MKSKIEIRLADLVAFKNGQIGKMLFSIFPSLDHQYAELTG